MWSAGPDIKRDSALVVLLLLALATPATAAVERPLSADLLGKFAFGECPAGAPTGARCLRDRVSGPISYLGQSTGDFEVVIDAAATGADGCAPTSKRGSFVAADGGRLDLVAHGRYCFATSATTYVYTATGGSGRFAGATGTGSYVVPPPRTFNGTSGEGEEHLRGTIALSEPGTVTKPGAYGRLRFGHIGPSDCRTRLRARVLSNRQGLHRVVVTIHRGSSRGRTLGRSRRFGVASKRVVEVHLRRTLRPGSRYVAVAVGRDRAGHRVTATRNFRLRGR
jgi:hypothetical protein